MIAKEISERFDPQKSWWPFISIVALTAVSILVTWSFLSSGRFTLFQNIYYFPILLASFFYARRGLFFSVLLSMVYFSLIMWFTDNKEIITGAAIRCLFFVFAGGMVAWLSWSRLRARELLYQSRLENTTLASKLIEKEMHVTRKTLVFKQNFLANMSHEMRTPLTGIVGNLELLKQLHTSAPQRECINDMLLCVDNLTNMIDQALDFSRIEQAELNLVRKPFAIRRSLGKIDNIYKQQFGNRLIEFQIVTDDNLPDTVIADKVRVMRVINILLSNALKFTQQGKVTLTVRVINQDNENSMVIKVEVADTGIGIDESKQKDIFKPFCNLHETDVRCYDGSGLGLTVARELVTLHGGEMGFTSKSGVGTSFWFTFEAGAVAHREEHKMAT